MKRSVSITIQTAVATGTSIVDVSDLVSIFAVIAGTFTATYQIMVSFDGTNFVQFGSNVTAASNVSLPDATVKIRVDCSAYTSGTPTGAAAGIRTLRQA